jgi:hypothetical protein
MNNMTIKSANQLYKESGTQLSFKDWIEREKAKGAQIPNVAANAEMESMLNAEGQTENNEPDKNKILLRNVATTLVVATLVFFIVKALRKKE